MKQFTDILYPALGSMDTRLDKLYSLKEALYLTGNDTMADNIDAIRDQLMKSTYAIERAHRDHEKRIGQANKKDNGLTAFALRFLLSNLDDEVVLTLTNNESATDDELVDLSQQCEEAITHALEVLNHE